MTIFQWVQNMKLEKVLLWVKKITLDWVRNNIAINKEDI